MTKLGTRLPSEIKLWFQNHRISAFWDKPRQCAKCYKYNHSTRTCTRDAVCKKCAQSHESACSSDTTVCINCQGPHEADDKNCPLYAKEVKIQKFKSENHFTISEARRQFKETSSANTYAKVAASSVPSPCPQGDFITKTELEATLKSFSENLTAMFQSALEAQLQLCREFIESATASILETVQVTLQARPKIVTKASRTDSTTSVVKKSKLESCAFSMDTDGGVPPHPGEGVSAALYPLPSDTGP